MNISSATYAMHVCKTWVLSAQKADKYYNNEYLYIVSEPPSFPVFRCHLREPCPSLAFRRHLQNEKRDHRPRKWMEKEAMKTENAMGGQS